jgi:CHAT domain-containing protein
VLSAAEASQRRREADYLVNEGRFADAEGELDSLLAELGDAPTLLLRGELCAALLAHAQVLRLSNRFEEAVREIARVEALVENLPALVRRGHLLAVLQLKAIIHALPHSPFFDPSVVEEQLRQMRMLYGDDSAWLVDVIEADLAHLRRDWRRLIELGDSAIAALQKGKWLFGVAAMRRKLAEAYLESGDLPAAEPLLLEARAHARAKGPPDLLSGVEMQLARLRSRQGRHEEAWEFAESALDQVDRLIRGFRVLSEQQRFVVDKLDVYRHAFVIARAGGATPAWLYRAWSVAERAKSFYLCQLVANAEVTLFADVSPSVLGRLRELEDAVDVLERSAAAAPLAAREEQQARLQALYRERQALTDSIMQKNPRWAAVRPAAGLPLEEVFRSLDNGQQKWIPLSFYWEEPADLHLFYSTAPGTVDHEVTHWSADDRQLLRTVGSDLTGRVSPAAVLCPEALIEKILPAAVRTKLRACNGSGLLISPHLDLHKLPLHALGAEGTTLLDHSPVQYIPTFTLLPLRRAPERVTHIGLIGCVRNGFGDPPLDDVDGEIRDIAKAWSSRRAGAVQAKMIPAEGKLADCGMAVSEWRRFEYLHIACHGVFPEGRPFDAALRLGREAVRAAELFGTKLNAKLVSLSACALGRREDQGANASVRADEWVGMYLPLFYAGASAMLVSLWDAESEAAAKLMAALHENLAAADAPAAALRKALPAVADRPASHWANWILVGVPSDQQS